MKKQSIFTLVIALVVGFSACKKDDTTSSGNTIVGKWNLDKDVQK